VGSDRRPLNSAEIGQTTATASTRTTAAIRAGGGRGGSRHDRGGLARKLHSRGGRERRQDRRRLGGRDRAKLLLQVTGKGLVRLLGAEAVAAPDQQGQEAADPCLVIGRQRRGTPGPADRDVECPPLLLSLDQPPGPLRRPGPQFGPPFLHPLLESGGAAGEEPGQQIALVECQRLLPAASTGCGLEGGRITPEVGGVQPDLLVPPVDQYPIAQGLPQMEQGLAKGVAGLFGIKFGPEQGQ
jgi:hypothetical protein